MSGYLDKKLNQLKNQNESMRASNTMPKKGILKKKASQKNLNSKPSHYSHNPTYLSQYGRNTGNTSQGHRNPHQNTAPVYRSDSNYLNRARPNPATSVRTVYKPATVLSPNHSYRDVAASPGRIISNPVKVNSSPVRTLGTPLRSSPVRTNLHRSPARVAVSSPHRNIPNKLLDQRDEHQIMSRIENGAYDDLKSKFMEEDFDKSQLESEVRDLNNQLDSQKRHTQNKEHEMLNELQKMQQETQQYIRRVQEADQAARGARDKGDQIKRDRSALESLNLDLNNRNKILRKEIQNLGEKTNVKITQLDTKLNGALRLRDHEKKNHEFLVEGLEEEFRMICDEMKNDYGSQESDIKRRVQASHQKREKLKRELEQLNTEIKNLFFRVEGDTKRAYQDIKDDARRELEQDKKQLDSKIRSVEQSINQIKNKNLELLRELENQDRLQKSKVLNEVSNLNRLKEEFMTYNQDISALRKQLDQGIRHSAHLQSEISRKEAEEQVLADKLRLMHDEQDAEVENLSRKQELDRRQFEDVLIDVQDNEKQKAIQEKEIREKLNKLRRDYEDRMDELHNGLNSALNHTLGDYSRGER